MKLDGLKAVRFSFADQHGVLRGKTLAASEAKAAMERGVGFPGTLILKDTSHRTVFPAFTPGAGIGMAQLESAACPQGIESGIWNGRRRSGCVTRRRMIERWAMVIARVAPKA